MAALPITPAWFPMRPHPVQSELWRTKARFVCLPSGRGSGKTEIAKRRLVMYSGINRDLCGERPPEAKGLKHLYAYLGPTRSWTKRVAWDHLKALMPKEWVVSISESDLIIKTIFNSELHAIGMDRPARFEGDQWDGVVEDESSDQNKDIELSVRPAIAYKQGWWWKIGIPKRMGSGAPAYRKLCLAGKTDADPRLKTYSWPSWDVLPKEEVDDMRRRMDPKDFNEQVGGQWEAIGGAAFYQFNRDVHAAASLAHDPTRPLLVGCDFNVTPMAWVICHSDGKSLQVIDELWLENTNTQSALNTLWDRYGNRHRGGWTFYGDPAARQRKTSASFSDYAHILNDKRFKATVTFDEAHPRVKDRLSSCNALLRNAADEVRCHVDPKCEHLINDLENRGLHPDGSPLDADKLMGHVSDALGYLIHKRWPSTIIEPDEDSQAAISIYTEDF